MGANYIQLKNTLMKDKIQLQNEINRLKVQAYDLIAEAEHYQLQLQAIQKKVGEIAKQINDIQKQIQTPN